MYISTLFLQPQKSHMGTYCSLGGNYPCHLAQKRPFGTDGAARAFSGGHCKPGTVLQTVARLWVLTLLFLWVYVGVGTGVLYSLSYILSPFCLF